MNSKYNASDENDATDVEVPVPPLLQRGTVMTKVSAKSRKSVTFRVDPDRGYILWESKKSGIIPIENIEEIRVGADARHEREQFQLSISYEPCWMTIIYTVDARYKSLHIIATELDVLAQWVDTLRAMHAVCAKQLGGLSLEHAAGRQAAWERRYLRGPFTAANLKIDARAASGDAPRTGAGAGAWRDEQLSFEEVEGLCRKLEIGYSREDLLRRFRKADSKSGGYLDFADFRRFVRLLKERPEMTRLYKRLINECAKDSFTFDVFEFFMRTYQKSNLARNDLEAIFHKYATLIETTTPTQIAESTLVPTIDNTQDPREVSVGEKEQEHPQLTSTIQTSAPANLTLDSGQPRKDENQSVPLRYVLSLDAFTTFLLSVDNAVFTEKHGRVWQDMTRPLSEYYISSSHNTYLVGNQLVGTSTVEGYIRSLLHSCRSVELDIYDGEPEPVVYHGKTLTSKVSVRDICRAIAKYAFVASPYPVIISAEIHCSIVQQEILANIMHEEFGSALVSVPPGDKSTAIDILPSPEQLRGRILFKTKNKYIVAEKTDQGDGKRNTSAELSSEEESIAASFSESSGSASETDFAHGLKSEIKHELDKAHHVETELKHELEKARHVNAVKEIREELRKAQNSETIKEMKEELGHLRDKVFHRGHSKTATRSDIPPPSIGIQHSATMPTPGHASMSPPTLYSSASLSSTSLSEKPKMSLALLSLLVYTVGVKYRGLNKKETYAPVHMFSLSERTVAKLLRTHPGAYALVKHCRSHPVRVYPAGTRLGSSNYEPHKVWAAGVQLVALNWQTFDLGYTINHAMFQRNGRAGYVLKPSALREPNKEILSKHTNHALEITIISAQQLPRRKDGEGREISSHNIINPYVEVSVHTPDWTRMPFTAHATQNAGTDMHPQRHRRSSASSTASASAALAGTGIPKPIPASSNNTTSSSSAPLVSAPASSPSPPLATTSCVSTMSTNVVKNNGFNPVWEEALRLPFSVVGDMRELVFLRFVVRAGSGSGGGGGGGGEGSEPLAVYCAPLYSLQQGYRHLPLLDAQLSQYLYSTLFVHLNVRDV